MNKRIKKFLTIALCGSFIIGCIASAATQISEAKLKPGSTSAKGNNINGGVAVLEGAVNGDGTVLISAYKVVQLWPDDELKSFFVSSTEATSLELDDELLYKNLYYARIDKSKKDPGAWAKLKTEYVY